MNVIRTGKLSELGMQVRWYDVRSRTADLSAPTGGTV
jgi:hypothetical protein